MDPIERLKAEHRVIEKVLTRIEAAAGAAAAFDAALLGDGVEFLRLYADARHHGKEEARLFPMMVERGFSPETGPIASMLEEHGRGRELVQEAAKWLARAREGNEAARTVVRRSLRFYCGLLREHIAKEDAVLFDLARRVLTPRDLDALESEFAALDAGDPAGSLAARLSGEVAETGDAQPRP